MKSTPEIVTALLELKNLSSEFYDRLHDQEHFWEACEYEKLEDVFDNANRDVWCLHHKFLKRLFDLGGKPPGVTDDVNQAYANALAGFTKLHTACVKLYTLLDDDDDYVTMSMAMKVQKQLESWINYLEAKMAQVKYVGTEEFMTEQMD